MFADLAAQDFKPLVDLQKNTFIYHRRSIRLSPQVAEIAYLLVQNFRSEVPVDDIRAGVWGASPPPTYISSIRASISNLRSKIMPLPLIVLAPKPGFYMLTNGNTSYRSWRSLSPYEDSFILHARDTLKWTFQRIGFELGRNQSSVSRRYKMLKEQENGREND